MPSKARVPTRKCFVRPRISMPAMGSFFGLTNRNTQTKKRGLPFRAARAGWLEKLLCGKDLRPLPQLQEEYRCGQKVSSWPDGRSGGSGVGIQAKTAEGKKLNRQL